MAVNQYLFDTAPRPLQSCVAFSLTPIIFFVDTLTEIESAVAATYVLVMIIMADALSRRGIIALATCCAGLSTISFLFSHGLNPNLSTQLRLGVVLSAILVTARLLLRDYATRKRLTIVNKELSRSESRYRTIFEQARSSLFELDLSAVVPELELLRSQGVTDLAAHARRVPHFHDRMADLIVTADANSATHTILASRGRATLIGPIAARLPPREHSLIPMLQAVQDADDYFEGPGRLVAFDGSLRIVLVTLNFREVMSPPHRVIGTLVDITQREQTHQALSAARAELARASRVAAVGVLSASIAHEINQPLGAVVMNAQTCLRWLSHDPPDLSSAANAAQRVVKDGMRASEIVGRTRGLLVKGARPNEPIDLRELTSEVAAMLDEELMANSTQLVEECPPGLPAIMANRVEMQQVLINLITNGIQAMSATPAPSKQIVVTVDRVGLNQIKVSVRDRGAGIRECERIRLFDAFFTTKSQGMGMGLAISRSVIEARGGRLSAQNHADGGAVFEFILPVTAEAA